MHAENATYDRPKWKDILLPRIQGINKQTMSHNKVTQNPKWHELYNMVIFTKVHIKYCWTEQNRICMCPLSVHVSCWVYADKGQNQLSIIVIFIQSISVQKGCLSVKWKLNTFWKLKHFYISTHFSWLLPNALIAHFIIWDEKGVNA